MRRGWGGRGPIFLILRVPLINYSSSVINYKLYSNKDTFDNIINETHIIFFNKQQKFSPE